VIDDGQYPDSVVRPLVDAAGLVAALRRILPDDAVLHEPEDLRPYECDGLSAPR